MNWTAVVFLALGAVFGVMGNLGVLIFPDVYTRLQASSTASTSSVFSVLVACMFAAGWSPMSGKIAVIALFLISPAYWIPPRPPPQCRRLRRFQSDV